MGFPQWDKSRTGVNSATWRAHSNNHSYSLGQMHSSQEEQAEAQRLTFKGSSKSNPSSEI